MTHGYYTQISCLQEEKNLFRRNVYVNASLKKTESLVAVDCKVLTMLPNDQISLYTEDGHRYSGRIYDSRSVVSRKRSGTSRKASTSTAGRGDFGLASSHHSRKVRKSQFFNFVLDFFFGKWQKIWNVLKMTQFSRPLNSKNKRFSAKCWFI